MEQILSYDKNTNDDYYSVLGCSEFSTEEQITTEFRARVLSCHPDKHPEDPKAAERFALLSKAKETLTNPDSRSKYDKWRRSGIAMSYENWCGFRGAAHTSMHWATKAPQPQLPSADQHTNDVSNAANAECVDHSDSSSKKNLERSPSPRQASPYHKAQRVDLTFSSKEKTLLMDDRVNWTPQTGTGLLEKFRNYKI